MDRRISDFENEDHEESSSVQPFKSKVQISALEKYGFMNPSKLHANQDDDYDDDYDDDDYNDLDVEEFEEDFEEEFEEEFFETESFNVENTVYETAEDETQEHGLDDESFDDGDMEFTGDWNVLQESVDGEEESDEEEDLEEQERRLNAVRKKKDILIFRYLTLMKHLTRLKRKNIYLQDYLYKLCFRKNLIKEPSEVRNIISDNLNSAIKLKRQKKKRDAKMASNFEAVVNSKPPVIWSPETKTGRKPTRGQLTRARRLVRGDHRPPDYTKKLDTKFVSIAGIQYQRILRSASRNWPEKIEQDDTKRTVAEIQNPTKENLGQEIPHGLPGAPKQRVLVKIVQPKIIKTTEKQALKKKNSLPTVPSPTLHSHHSKKIQIEGKELKHLNENAKSRRKTRRSEKLKGMRESMWKLLEYTETGEQPLDVVNDKPKPTEDKRIRRSTRKKSKKYRVKYSTRQIFEIPKHRCRRKRNKKFREFNWFEQGKLRGRQFSGTKLISAEKQHLIRFVNSAIAENTSREASHKLKNKRNLNSTALDWNNACKRLFQLIVKKEELEKQHEKTMEDKFVGWSFWEKRNELGVEGLLNIFKTFIPQEHFTKGELRKFIPEIAQFDQLLNQNHSRLMDQLIKMYKSQLSLLLVQRRVKDKTNQTLAHQGLSIGYYEQLSLENKSLYDSIRGKEQHLEKQRQKLASIMKNMVLTRDFKISIDTSVKNAFNMYRVALEDCLNKRNSVLKAMKKCSGIMKNNKPLLLQATLVLDRPHLLRDFSSRKKCLENLEKTKRMLTRKVYLGERELNIIHVKMKNIQIDLREINEKNARRIMRKDLRVHKAAIGGRLENLISKSTNHCEEQLWSKSTVCTPLNKRTAWK